VEPIMTHIVLVGLDIKYADWCGCGGYSRLVSNFQLKNWWRAWQT
jgi:hypothetical protein